jgi:hypothetical protein
VRPAREQPRALALGIKLAGRGGLVRTSLGVALVGALIAALYPFVAKHPVVNRLPTTATLAVAWSGGVMLAFASSLRALGRDWEDGIVALARARGVRPERYVRARVGGVVFWLALAVGGTAVVSTLAATAATRAPLVATRDGLAAVAYALAFAATLGPLAMAALGARSRGQGYLWLFATLILPELLARWTGRLLPPGWHELTSIPAALAAVMNGVKTPRLGYVLALLRALAGLAAVVALALAIVRRQVPRVSRRGAGETT